MAAATEGQSDVVYYPPQNPPPYDGLHQPQAMVQGPVAIVVNQHYGSKPTVTQCRACRAEIVTRVSFRPSMRTHLMALALCILFCWPCVCVPYCVASCNSVDHYCPNCNAFVGSYAN